MTDRDFLKTFSGLIAALAALAVIIFVLAQMVVSGAGLSKDKMAAKDDAKDIAARIKPVGEVAIGSPVMGALVSSANAADKGQTIYNGTCVACHGAGIAGAPKVGDKAAWAPRIAQGAAKLHEHAIKGFQGKSGVMPAKGGNTALPDADVAAAVDYMISQAK